MQDKTTGIHKGDLADIQKGLVCLWQSNVYQRHFYYGDGMGDAVSVTSHRVNVAVARIVLLKMKLYVR